MSAKEIIQTVEASKPIIENTVKALREEEERAKKRLRVDPPLDYYSAHITQPSNIAQNKRV